MLYGLRRGGIWQKESVELQVFFHVICRRRGSQAIWLQDRALLITRDSDEAAKGYPYEEWFNQAIVLLDLYHSAHEQ